MKAIVFHAAEDLRIDEVPEPVPLRGQVKLRNSHVGICGTDVHVYYDPDTSGRDFSKPHPLTGASPPQILGHEFSGTVAEIGDGVDNLAVGDRVTVWPVYSCGKCRACTDGRPNLCAIVAYHGLESNGGGLATYTTVNAEQCVKLPSSVDLELGALVEPMAVAWHAVRRTTASAGSRALIVGAGPIGIGIFIALKERGVNDIFVSEPSPSRRAAIQRFGVQHVIDPSMEDLVASVRELTRNDGVDYLFDAAGIAPALEQGLSLLAPRGTAVVVAIHTQAISLHPMSLILPEIVLTGACSADRQDFVDVVEAMSRGVYDTTGWVTGAGFDDVEAAIKNLHSGLGLKAVVSVGD